MLEVPYISQLEPGALARNNDCGAASGLMIVKAYKPGITMTVDEFYRAPGVAGDQYLSAGQIRSVMASLGVASAWSTGWGLGRLYETVVSKRPAMVLVNYGLLAGYVESSFRGAHFLVVVSLTDEAVICNDPLYRDNGGYRVAYPAAVFSQAWQGCNAQGNPNGGALVPVAELGEPLGALFQVRLKMNMNVRAGPGTGYRIIGDLPRDAVVSIYSQSGDWGEFQAGKWVCIASRYAVKI